MKKLFLLYVGVFTLAIVAVVSSCSKKKDSGSGSTSTTSSTGSTTSSAQICYPTSVSIHDDNSGNTVAYAVSYDGNNNLSGYSQTQGGSESFSISSSSATKTDITSTGGSKNYVLELTYDNGGIISTTMKTGSTVSPITYTYQLLTGSPRVKNTVQYRFTSLNGKRIAQVEWQYDASGNPYVENISHDSPDFNIIDTSVRYTFDSKATPLNGKGAILTGSHYYYSALDFWPHNVLTAIYKDKDKLTLGTSTYTYTDYSADGKPGKQIITDFFQKTTTWQYNCK